MKTSEILDSLTPEGEPAASLMAVLNPEWVAAHTPFASLDALIKAAGFDIADFTAFEDFERANVANLIASRKTIPFATFGEMLAAAGADWQVVEAERAEAEKLADEIARLEWLEQLRIEEELRLLTDATLRELTGNGGRN